MGRASNQDADALASESLKVVTVGVVKLQDPKLQGKESLHDVICFLETGEPPPHLTKGERRWLARKAVRCRLINEDLFCQGKDQVLKKVPSQEDIHRILHPAIMMYVVGNLHMSSPAGKFCKRVLFVHLYKEMRISGAHLVMLVNARDLGGSFMAPSIPLLHLGHLKNGELMPLGPCQGLSEWTI